MYGSARYSSAQNATAHNLTTPTVGNKKLIIKCQLDQTIQALLSYFSRFKQNAPMFFRSTVDVADRGLVGLVQLDIFDPKYIQAYLQWSIRPAVNS